MMRVLIDLVESMEYGMLLLETEQRQQWLIKTFGKKLRDKFLDQYSRSAIPAFVLQTIIPDAEARRDVEKIPEAELQRMIVDLLMSRDPTRNKAYSRWIVLQYLKQDEKLEDIDQILYRNLELFSQAANSRRVNGDIDKIKSFSELFDVIQPFLVGQRETSSNLDRKAKRNTKIDVKVARQWDDDPMLSQAKIIYDGDDYLILVPETAEAAAYFGKNTNWCTTTTWAYSNYASKGPLYIILRRSDSRRWQFHFETTSFMDEHDRSINLNEFFDANHKAASMIGLDKFAALIGISLRSVDENHNSTYQYLSLKHFPREVIDAQPDSVLVRTITKFDDLRNLPAERVQTKDFCKELFTNSGFFNHRRPVSSTEISDVVGWYVSKLNDQEFFTDLAMKSFRILQYLPKSYQTDQLKEYVAKHCYRYAEVTDLIPKPWTEKIETYYWDTRIGEDQNLAAGEVPEKFRSDTVLVYTLARYPDDIKNFEARVSGEMAAKIVRVTLDNKDHGAYETFRVINALPESSRTSVVHKIIYDKAKNLTKVGEQDDRFILLQALTRFDHSMWPWKASKLSNEMAIANPNFMANPEQFHSVGFAALWVAMHHSQLHTLSKQFVDQKVVERAFSGCPDPKSYADFRDFFTSTLGPCDEKIVTTEMVETVFAGNRKLCQGWLHIPQKYLTRELIDEVLKFGLIPFDHENYPADAYTPDNIANRFSAVPQTVTIVNSWNRKIEPNTHTIQNNWYQLDEQYRNIDALKELFKRKYFGIILAFDTGVDKKLLNSEALTSFLENVNSYSEKECFAAFPKTSYNRQNMAMAVKKGFISAVPERFQDDGVMINLILNTPKNVDWEKITPDVFMDAVMRDPTQAEFALTHHVPAGNKLFFDANIAREFLKKEKGTDPKYGYSTVSDAELEKIYKEPKYRKNWTQDCYDMGAGSIIPLEEIPEQFRSDAVYIRAVSTKYTDIQFVPNTVQWLNNNEAQLEESILIKIIRFGFVCPKHGKFIDAATTNRVKLDGAKGSYFYTEIEPRGAVGMIYDGDRCVDAILYKTHVESNYHHYGYGNDKQLSSGASDISHLTPYRKIIADLLGRHKELAKNGLNWGRMSIFSEEGTYKPVEDWARRKMEGSDLTFVHPSEGGYGSYSGVADYVFDGDGPFIGIIKVDSDRGDTTSVQYDKFTEVNVSRLMELSAGFASFLRMRNVASGQSPTFKETFMYKRLGVRGPGKKVWYTLLDEKLHDAGELSVWKYGKGVGMRVTIAHNKEGVLAVGKKTKDGFVIDYEAGVSEDMQEKIGKLYDSIWSKV